ncbi:MAG: AbrB/MazE/SpoVT family DNA-binding domain-containing protein [bacterium]|nr:AbrB/MazE/SpoVT family DNA-binding domain-containing protein [bacterium]
MKATDESQGRYAWTARVGEKGQIVIPKEARDLFNIHPGDTILLLGDKEQGMAIPPQDRFEEIFGDIFGRGKN